MIAVELIRRSRSADAIGPCGSRTPPEQPAKKGSSIRARATLGDGVRRFEGRKTIDQYIDDEPASVTVLGVGSCETPFRQIRFNGAYIDDFAGIDPVACQVRMRSGEKPGWDSMTNTRPPQHG
jgi:hypothetical protein